MRRWLAGNTSSTTIDSREHTGVDSVPAFPALGSIQRAGSDGSNGMKVLDRQDSSEHEQDEQDEDDEHRKAVADLDLFISPPSPERNSLPSVNNATLIDPSSGQEDEFKAPSFSLSITSPSLAAKSPGASSSILKSKPKPSHRPFPAEPASASLLNNGRVTLSNGNKNGQSLGSSLGLPPSTTVKPRKQRFVALEPGYSPLDWARLNKEGDDYELRVGEAVHYIS